MLAKAGMLANAVKQATAGRQMQQGSRETIYTGMTAAETSTAAGPPVGKSAAVEGWDTGCRMPDAKNVRNSMVATS
jgi:hypothetical protein